MDTQGIEGIRFTTHSWEKSVKFFQSLGFTIEFESDHNSGQLRNGDGPYVFLAEVPKGEPLETHFVLTVADADTFQPAPGVDVVTPFEETHWGTREMTVRDPDGRIWKLQAPGKK